MSNKRDKSHPRLLPQVLRAVAELKDINGSTAKKIVSRVNELIKRCRTSGPKPRNVTMQVRKALHHGIENGLLKYRGGRYKLVFGGKSRNTRTMATRRTAAAPAPRRRQANASKGRTRKRTTRPKAVQRKKRKRSSSSSKSSSSEDNTTSGDGNETTDSASSMTVSGSSASSSMNTSDARDSTSQSVESFTVESKKDDKNNKSSEARPQQQTLENSHNSNTNAAAAEVPEERIARCDNPNCLCNVDVFTDDTVYDSTKHSHDVQNISYIN
ncbi:uncharacterized protein LOC108741457 isoform X4 [Agrilus planipennis]|uniref:Uncharacterized protein LOC108741457 isoform X4 n=1 Tax=Agrilus planipennis TaxID=224129 RepID=A0A1W4XHE3_AGRPL|nr:uncharacterized protein LOC108741457 isoform X4 [Agrilus planipennis]